MSKLPLRIFAAIGFATLASVARGAQPGPADEARLKAAVKQHVTVSPAEVTARIDRLLEEQHLTTAQLQAVLTAAGENEASFRGHIAMQIAMEKTFFTQTGFH